MKSLVANETLKLEYLQSATNKWEELRKNNLSTIKAIESKRMAYVIVSIEVLQLIAILTYSIVVLKIVREEK